MPPLGCTSPTPDPFQLTLRPATEMGKSIEFTVYRGSKDGAITKGKTRREIGHNDAVVKITHSGVCGTDEHALQAGCVLGHEGIGIVTEIGPGVTAVKVGDRVGFGYVHYTCGHCEQCRTGIPPHRRV
jgi:D-arabinose 1-dehydrogenase-like Zn-dependent alcohol dehydrogenase